MTSNSSFKFTIRAKLLLLSVVILGIPYIGFENLREQERHLRDALDTSLVDAAKAIAGPLHEREALFQIQNDNPGETLFVHEMTHAIQIDGYTPDWKAYIDWSDTYQLPEETSTPASFSFRLIVGRYQQTLYALIQVKDDSIIYQNVDKPDSIDNDHIMLVLTDHYGELKHYYFSPTAPGKIRPFSYETFLDEFGDEYQNVEYATNISGEWQSSTEGYNLEIAIPLSLAGDRLGFIAVDSDGNEVGTAGDNTASSPGRLLQSSRQIRQIVSKLSQVQDRRVWVLNNQGQVLASSGTLDKILPEVNRNIFYSLILPAVSTRVSDDLAGKSRLQGQEVKQALSGKTETRWRSSPDGKAVIVSAATPIWIQDEVRGVVVVEESSSGIQMLRRNATASLFNKTLLIFIVVTSLLLLFATRLSSRLKHLSQQASAAIDKHGRVAGDFQVDESHDEIGEVSQNYAVMLGRLREYNHYLENMAGRLSHEFRTPIAVVQSSLEQFEVAESPAEAQLYVERAKQGMERLSLILTRLSEATRLEQAMQSADIQATDINELLINCTEGYRLAYPHNIFELELLNEGLITTIAPDLFVQMLDKLIANAVDFSSTGKAIELKLSKNNRSWQMAVINYGSSLPEDMEDQLFNSMISLRQDKTDKGPHLGLGLYIVRLIAEFFDGGVKAENLSNETGVSVMVDIPIKLI
ncbi:MAG: two-component system sensor histidine kinase ChvG [Gammaproteobacteria bacterium]|jgi:two-component system sensor histidine kinase ChvG